VRFRSRMKWSVVWSGWFGSNSRSCIMARGCIESRHDLPPWLGPARLGGKNWWGSTVFANQFSLHLSVPFGVPRSSSIGKNELKSGVV
jgi:hypothetical protein